MGGQGALRRSAGAADSIVYTARRLRKASGHPAQPLITKKPCALRGFGPYVPIRGSIYGKRRSHADKRGGGRRFCSGCTALWRILPEEPA